MWVLEIRWASDTAVSSTASLPVFRRSPQTNRAADADAGPEGHQPASHAPTLTLASAPAPVPPGPSLLARSQRSHTRANGSRMRP